MCCAFLTEGWDSVEWAFGNPFCDMRNDKMYELATSESSTELCCVLEREASSNDVSIGALPLV